MLDGLFLVAEQNKKIIGTIMGAYEGHRGLINYLAMDHEFRLQGLASELVSVLEEKLKDLGCPKINLFVRRDNIEVEQFDKKLEFQNKRIFVFSVKG